jgi:hypothetical protein
VTETEQVRSGNTECKRVCNKRNKRESGIEKEEAASPRRKESTQTKASKPEIQEIA